MLPEPNTWMRGYVLVAATVRQIDECIMVIHERPDQITLGS